MKRRWTPEELDEHWALLPAELPLLANKAGPTRVGFSVMLKAFQLEGQFPEPQAIPSLAVAHIAQQVSVPADLFLKYDWGGRAARYHRAQIREFAGFRESTDADAHALGDWVQRTLAPEDDRMEHLRQAVLDRCRELRMDPPSPGRVERLLRSGLHANRRRLTNRGFPSSDLRRSPEPENALIRDWIGPSRLREGGRNPRLICH